MTRIEAGVLTLNRSTVSVKDLITESIAAMGSTLQENSISVTVPDDFPEVDIDRVLMGQALINLLDNAARHSPAHSVITVNGERRGSQVVLSVADQGPGVPAGDRETIFDRFTQISTGGRAGLGLTIAKTFVEAHGQRVWYEEDPSGGARFVVSLPVAQSVSHA
jgi:two-component system sensor histidine kinase KdpD